MVHQFFLSLGLFVCFFQSYIIFMSSGVKSAGLCDAVFVQLSINDAMLVSFIYPDVPFMTMEHFWLSVHNNAQQSEP